MPVFDIEIDGQPFEVDAPDAQAAAGVAQRLRSAIPKPEQPIQNEDWAGLGQRVQAAETKALDLGPNMPEMLADIRKAEAARQGQMYGKTRPALETFGRQVADTFALGAPNYLEALTAGRDSGLSFPERHEFIKAAASGRGEANPKSDIAGVVGGIVPQVVASGGTMAPTVLGRMAQGTATGAALSGAQAGIESRGDLGEMAKRSALGAGLGVLGTGAVEAATPAIRAAGDYLARRSAKFSGPAGDQAAARILEVARSRGITPEQAQAELARLGPEGMVADVLGTGGQRLARTAANTSDDAQQLIEDALTRRSAGTADRLTEVVSDVTGVQPGQTVRGLQDAIRTESSPAITALYNEARRQGADLPNTPFAHLMQSPMVQRAIRQAEEETQNRVVAFGPGQNSRLAVFDAAKQNLDDIAEAATRNGERGTANMARELARQLRETVDNFSGAYAPARQASREMFRRQDAVQAGADAARTPRAATIQAVADLAGPEAGQGWAAQFMDTVFSKRGTPGLTDAVLGNPNAVAAMQQALGNAAQRVTERADIERLFARTQRGATGNSSTARQLADLGIIPGAAGVGYLGGYDPMQAGGIAALAVAGRRGVNKLLDARRAVIEKDVAREMAQLLTLRRMPNPPARAINATERRIADLLVRVGRQAAAPVGAMTGSAIASQ